MAFDYIHINCIVCKGQNVHCPECKGKGKRRVDINYHPISQKPFTDEEYELITTSMQQMFNAFRGEGEKEETLPRPGFISYRAKKAE
jgi:hypothetical protein